MKTLRLTVDAGNSSVKLAAWSDGRIVARKKAGDITQGHIEEIAAAHDAEIKDVIVSSVRRHGGWDEKSVPPGLRAAGFRVVDLSSSQPLPITIDYATPQTLGADRIAALVGALTIAPGADLLVVDAGTAVTYDYLSSSGRFEGGNIAAGISMRLSALHALTSALPEVGVDGSLPLLGRSTDEAMRAGAIRGVVAEIEAYRRWLNAAGKAVKVILTGGDSECLASLTDDCIVEPDLVMIGLDRVGDYIERNMALSCEITRAIKNINQ